MFFLRALVCLSLISQFSKLKFELVKSKIKRSNGIRRIVDHLCHRMVTCLLFICLTLHHTINFHRNKWKKKRKGNSEVILWFSSGLLGSTRTLPAWGVIVTTASWKNFFFRWLLYLKAACFCCRPHACLDLEIPQLEQIKAEKRWRKVASCCFHHQLRRAAGGGCLPDKEVSEN